MEPSTIDDFIKKLQAISEDKRKLPLVMYAPNGLECPPQIKIGYDDPMLCFTADPTKMVISYE